MCVEAHTLAIHVSGTEDDEWLLLAFFLDFLHEKFRQLCLCLGALNRDKICCEPIQNFPETLVTHVLFDGFVEEVWQKFVLQLAVGCA